MRNNDATAEAILAKPYGRVLTPDPAGGYTATIREFPGCLAEGDTPGEALENLELAARAWLESALRSGYAIPEPVDFGGYSGKIALRISRSLHQLAASRAEKEGISLNQFIGNAVASAVAKRDTEDHVRELLETQFRRFTGLMAMPVVQTGMRPVVIASEIKGHAVNAPGTSPLDYSTPFESFGMYGRTGAIVKSIQAYAGGEDYES